MRVPAQHAAIPNLAPMTRAATENRRRRSIEVLLIPADVVVMGYLANLRFTPRHRDDGEVFTNVSGTLGINGDYFGAVGGDWHRVVLVFDMASATPMTTYIDGVLNHAHTVDELGGPPNAAVDGRWALLNTFKSLSLRFRLTLHSCAQFLQ